MEGVAPTEPGAITPNGMEGCNMHYIVVVYGGGYQIRDEIVTRYITSSVISRITAG
jgi:hypothetical protein